MGVVDRWWGDRRRKGMKTLQKELKRYGFRMDKNKLGFANLERVTAVR